MALVDPLHTPDSDQAASRWMNSAGSVHIAGCPILPASIHGSSSASARTAASLSARLPAIDRSQECRKHSRPKSVQTQAARGSLGSGRDQEPAVAHDLFFSCIRLKPDVEAEADHIDVGAGAPGCAGVLAIGIAEGDVDAGKFLILENVADDALDAEVGADGKLAHAIGVFIGVRVGPKVGLKLLV